MTREQAEAAGWDFSFRPLGSEFCDCRSINMSTRLRIESPPETTAGKAIDAVLPAITAIERYAALEAENARLRAALAPFAEYYNRREYLRGIHEDYYRVVDIKVKTLRAAAKAMEESE